jgi:hypothetical protein
MKYFTKSYLKIFTINMDINSQNIGKNNIDKLE